MNQKSALAIASRLFITACWGFFTASGLWSQTSAQSYSAVKNDTSSSLTDLAVATNQPTSEPRTIPLHRIPPPRAMKRVDPVIQSSATTLVTTTSPSASDGVGANGSAPPDTVGAVGATQYVQWVNTMFAVYDKASGALVYGPVAGNTLWSGFGGPCETTNDGDAVVEYDKAANRWLMSQFANIAAGPPFYECLAVSTTSDATGSYYRYAFSFNAMNDYPKLGVWPDSYYLSANMFQRLGSGQLGYIGPQACALNRSAMLAGKAATMQCFQLSTWYYGMLPSDLDGSTAPPAGAPDYFVAFNTDSAVCSTQIPCPTLWRFHTDWTTPGNSTFSGPVVIPVAAFNEGCSGSPTGLTCVPQMGTTQLLDSLGDHLMFRLAYRNFGDHESLVFNHTVNAGSTVGVRWYEIRNPGGIPTVYQQGTYAPSDGNYRWMGSIAMDHVGDIALGYSVSGPKMYPAIRYTGRVADPSIDPLGTMEAEVSLMEGSGAQINNLERWGDYSSMSVDPVDDCTFWYTNEYIPVNGSFNWNTHISSFKFPSCGGTTSAPAAPTNLVATAGNALVTLSWTASSGAASYNVLRATTSGGPYATIATGLTGTSYTNSGLTNGVTYYYVVQAVNSSGASPNSNQASATPRASATTAAPTALSASGAKRKINLAWTQSTTSGVTQNKVYRATTGGGPYSLLVTLSATTAYSDSNVTRGKTYYYMVTAVSSNGESAYSNQASAASR